MNQSATATIDVCEACQNWGENHKHDHDAHTVTVTKEKESGDAQIVPVYSQKTEE